MILRIPMCRLLVSRPALRVASAARRHQPAFCLHRHRLTVKTLSPPSTLPLIRCLATSSSSDILTERGFKPQQCPACGQQCFRPIVLQRHIEKCCPDLVDDTQQDLDMANMSIEYLEQWIAAAKEREDQKREQAVRTSKF